MKTKRKTKRKTTGGRIVKMALAIVLVAGALFFSPSLKTNAYTNENMPNGYRSLVDSDVGKVFGVDLETKIYFDTDFANFPPSDVMSDVLWFDLSNSSVLIDWVVPNALYLFELRSGNVATVGIKQSNSIYFHGGNETNDIEVYYAWYEDGGPGEEYYDEFFSIVDFTIPTGAYINDIYYDDVKNIILVKELALPSYEVTFATNGGTSITKLEDVEELPTPLPTTTKTNNIFVGWFYDSGFEEQAFSGDTITSNITLYAKWRLSEDYIAGYDDGYATGYGVGYWEGYDDGYSQGGIDVIDIGWFRTVMSGIAVIFSIKVFGDITLATFIGIPLLFAIILWIKKLLS